MTGAYQWDASYSGDANNSAVSDVNKSTEVVTVAQASPTITTTPNPSTVLLGGTLQDVAFIAGGFNPTGSITFRLYAPGVDPTVGPAAFTEMVTVNGDGTYHTTVGFASNATGTWHWAAAYTGDSNNNPASSGPLDEPVTIPPQAVLTLTKTVADAQPLLGENVTYTFTLVNAGPGLALNASVSDPFPAGLMFVSAAVPSQGTFDPATDVWTVGTLPAGAEAVLQVTAEVEVLGPIVNTATAAAVNIDPSLSALASSAALSVFQPATMVSKRSFLSEPGDPPDPPPGVSAELAALNQLFVAQLYRDLLGRAADPSGLLGWSALLDQGASRARLRGTSRAAPSTSATKWTGSTPSCCIARPTRSAAAAL